MNIKTDYNQSLRTEEIQAIIERMPTKFGFWVTGLVLFIVITLGLFSWIIKYPDIVTGQVVVNTNNSPVKLIANSSGSMILTGFHSQDIVKKGEYLGIIKNAAILSDIKKIQPLIVHFDLNKPELDFSKFPRNVFLGDLSGKYFAFINSFEQFMNFHNKNLLTKQEDILKKTISEQQNVIEVSERKLAMSLETSRLINKSYKRDSTLYSQKVLTEDEIDKSQLNTISAKDAYHTMLNNITSLREQRQESINKLEQTSIQKNEKEKQTRLDLISSYTDLSDMLKMWEQKYAFKSPIDGKVQFLKFWTNDQFIQSGDAAFTIVPLAERAVGQMILPAFGAGKVKVGQTVIIKLENYPFAEYGSIAGKISSISLTTNPFKTDNGEVEGYLINVVLPDQLKTNYGYKLDFKFQIKGTGEIITKDRRLVERLFDNLKYIIDK